MLAALQAYAPHVPYNSCMIDITVNGETTPLERPEPLAALLARLKLDPIRIAVEVNGEVVPRRRHGEAVVRPGDRIEIVTLVGGGQDPDAAAATSRSSSASSRSRVGSSPARASIRRSS